MIRKINRAFSLTEERLYYKGDNIAKFQRTLQYGLLGCIGISGITLSYELTDDFLNFGLKFLYGGFIGGLAFYLYRVNSLSNNLVHKVWLTK